MTLNLKSDAGRDILKKLASSADIFIENFKPGTMKRLGLDYETFGSIKLIGPVAKLSATPADFQPRRRLSATIRKGCWSAI